MPTHKNITFIVEVIGFVLAIFSIWYSYYLSEPAKLEVNYTVDVINNRLLISVKNTAFFKETGNVSLFRLEVSDSKPHMIIKSLVPNESFKFDLSINITSKGITIPSSEPTYPSLVNCTVPTYKLYFATEKSSISYKITCDNCFSQGVIRRIPDFQRTQIEIIFNPENKTCSGTLPIYSWSQVGIAELN